MSEFKTRAITPYDLAIYPSNHEEIDREALYQTRSGLLYICSFAEEIGLGIVLENRKVATANEHLAQLNGFVFEKKRPNELANFCETLAESIVIDRENKIPIRLMQGIFWVDGLLCREGEETTKKDRIMAALGRMGRDESPLASQSFADPRMHGSYFEHSTLQ